MAVPLFENTIVINSNQLIDWKDVGDGEDDTQSVFLGDEDWWNKHAYLLSLSDSDNQLNSEQREIIEDRLKKNQDTLKVNLLNAIYTASENYKKNYKSSCLAWFGKGLWGHKHGGKDRLATCEKWIERKERNYDVDNKILLKNLIQEINADLKFSGETGGSLAARVSRILFPKPEKAEQTIFQKIGSFFSENTLKSTLTGLYKELNYHTNQRKNSVEKKQDRTDCRVIRVEETELETLELPDDGTYYVQTFREDKEDKSKKFSNMLHYFEAKKKKQSVIFEDCYDGLSEGIIARRNKFNKENKKQRAYDLNKMISGCIKEREGQLSSNNLSKITALTKIELDKKDKKEWSSVDWHIHVSQKTMQNLKLFLESMPLFENPRKDKSFLQKLWTSFGYEPAYMSSNEWALLSDKPEKSLITMLEILERVVCLNKGSKSEANINLPNGSTFLDHELMRNKITVTLKQLLLNNASSQQGEFREALRFFDSAIKVAIYQEIDECLTKKDESASSTIDQKKLSEITVFYDYDKIISDCASNEFNSPNLSRLQNALNRIQSLVPAEYLLAEVDADVPMSRHI